MSQARYGNYVPLDANSMELRRNHAQLEKESRRESEEAREAYNEMEIARGLALEAIIKRLPGGVDTELEKTLDNLRQAGLRYVKEAEEDALTTHRAMKAMHAELGNITGEIAALQSAVGIKPAGSTGGGETSQTNGAGDAAGGAAQTITT